MDIQDILKNRPLPKEPEEGRAVKAYMLKTYHAKVQVIVTEHRLTIVVDSAALAGTLRLEMQNLVRSCQISKKIFIRIG